MANIENEVKKPKTVLQKILDVALKVIVVIVVIIAVFVLFVTITSKKSPDGAADIFGYQMRTILTGSMEKCKHEDPSEECDHVDVSKYEIGHLPVDTMIFIELVPEDKDEANEWYKNLKEGDVLTFQYTGMGVVTHRIIEIEPNSTGGYEIDLMGDNRGDDGTAGVQTIITNNADSANRVIGKVVGQSVFLGKAVTIIRKPVGAIFVILVPCLLIVIVEVVKIIVVLTEDKRAKRKAQNEERKALEEKTETAREDIEELKKQIEQTKLALNSTDAPKDEPDGE